MGKDDLEKFIEEKVKEEEQHKAKRDKNGSLRYVVINL